MGAARPPEVRTPSLEGWSDGDPAAGRFWHPADRNRRWVTASERRCHMSQIEESIEVEVPVSTAYNQWTQLRSSLGSWKTWTGSTRSTTRTRAGW